MEPTISMSSEQTACTSRTHEAQETNGSNGQKRVISCQTPEEAIRRYLANFDYLIPGKDEWKIRLMCQAEAKVYHLRKKQPNFYKHKLPKIINEACDELVKLSCTLDRNKKPADIGKTIHSLVHRDFMQILDELVESVPQSVISFEKEKDRLLVRDELCQRRIELEEQIYKLKASELDLDDLPITKSNVNDHASSYSETYDKIDRLERQLYEVSVRIIALYNKPIEEEIEFRLVVPQNSILNKLTEEQIVKLEDLMSQFAKTQKNPMEINKTIIDGMIDLLDINRSLFTKEELNILARDSLDAYTQFFRMLTDQRRHDFYDDLLSNKCLRPKEGLILKDENDVSEEIRHKLNSTDLEFKRRIEDCFESYAQREKLEDQQDEVEDDYDPIKETRELLESVRQSDPIFAQSRVKEEPFEEYVIELESGEVDENDGDNDPGNETANEGEMAERRETVVQLGRLDSTASNLDRTPPKMIRLESNSSSPATPTKRLPVPGQHTPSAQAKRRDTSVRPSSSGNNDNSQTSLVKQEYADEADDDDDIKFIGIVEPAFKIKHVNLD